MNAQTEVIRMLNDELRRNFNSGAAFMTPGVAALGANSAQRIFDAVAKYNNFSGDSDPYEEGDFGEISMDGHTIFFKIDYYSRDMSMASPDPSDPTVTTRVITMMLAEEY